MPLTKASTVSNAENRETGPKIADLPSVQEATVSVLQSQLLTRTLLTDNKPTGIFSSQPGSKY